MIGAVPRFRVYSYGGAVRGKPLQFFCLDGFGGLKFSQPYSTREEAEALVMQARLKAGWVEEADLAPPAVEEAPQPEAQA